MTTDRPGGLPLCAIALAVPCTGVALALGGLLLVQFGAIEPMQAFLLFVAGCLLGGALGLLLGALAALRSRGGARGGLGRALIACALSAALLFVVFAAAAPGRGLPRINDISTDLEDAPGLPPRPDASGAGDVPYPAAFAPLVRRAYPDLHPIESDLPAPEAWRRALATARSLGWSIRAERPHEGEFDASDRSRLFRFVDDVRVRVRSRAGGSLIDLRSRSRDGQGDLGANAERIRGFVERFAMGSDASDVARAR